MLKTRLQLGFQLENLKKVQNDMKQRELKEKLLTKMANFYLIFFSKFAFGSLRDVPFCPPPKKTTSLSEPKANSEERQQRVDVDIMKTCSLMCWCLCPKTPPTPKKRGGGE